MDPDGHALTKYVITATKQEVGGAVSSLLYAGQRNEVIVTLPVGKWDIEAGTDNLNSSNT